MGYRFCEKCGGTGRISSGTCVICAGTGWTRQRFVCPVCNGHFYVTRDPPLRVMCPHCSSSLLVEWTYVTIIERGTIPIPAPSSRAPLYSILADGVTMLASAAAVALSIIGATVATAIEQLNRFRIEFYGVPSLLISGGALVLSLIFGIIAYFRLIILVRTNRDIYDPILEVSVALQQVGIIAGLIFVVHFIYRVVI